MLWEEAMTTPHRMPLVTLGWQSWSVVAVIVTLVVLTGLFLVLTGLYSLAW